MIRKALGKVLFGFDSKNRSYATKYIFGATSSIITSLALITGFQNFANAKVSIIGSLLVIALADNISDMMGIHIYQEAEGIRNRDVWLSSFTNFSARFLVSLVFIVVVILFPIKVAAAISVVYGLLALAIFSYIIAKVKKIHPVHATIEHLGIAITVILISNYMGGLIIGHYR